MLLINTLSGLLSLAMAGGSVVGKRIVNVADADIYTSCVKCPYPCQGATTHHKYALEAVGNLTAWAAGNPPDNAFMIGVDIRAGNKGSRKTVDDHLWIHTGGFGSSATRNTTWIISAQSSLAANAFVEYFWLAGVDTHCGAGGLPTDRLDQGSVMDYKYFFAYDQNA